MNEMYMLPENTVSKLRNVILRNHWSRLILYFIQVLLMRHYHCPLHKKMSIIKTGDARKLSFVDKYNSINIKTMEDKMKQ